MEVVVSKEIKMCELMQLKKEFISAVVVDCALVSRYELRPSIVLMWVTLYSGLRCWM